MYWIPIYRKQWNKLLLWKTYSSYSSQEKGNWKRSSDTLSLFGKKIKFFPEGNDAEWELSNSVEMHMIRRNYINAYGKYKLKRQRKCQ